MCLIMKAESDECCINLPTANEIVIILLDEYNQSCFCDIVVFFCHIKGAQYDFSCVYSSHAVYMPLQYSLLFSYNDLD